MTAGGRASTKAKGCCSCCKKFSGKALCQRKICLKPRPTRAFQGGWRAAGGEASESPPYQTGLSLRVICAFPFTHPKEASLSALVSGNLIPSPASQEGEPCGCVRFFEGSPFLVVSRDTNRKTSGRDNPLEKGQPS